MKTDIKNKLKIAYDRLERYLKAEKAILSGQSYEMGDVKLTRANLKDVADMINTLKKEIFTLEAQLKGRSKFRVVRPGW